ncbi:hypothetical protein B0T19DRAFT_426456 [Cercophora scortea]|uniref:Uncharacterized protein n=1 Tax=Cercophora scortea TaxID=314031 RepID=A0AAE0MA57_9PEZI|nr:hypothetical protein B0T19DRAFT_426456 [Cercophora scortea]
MTRPLWVVLSRLPLGGGDAASRDSRRALEPGVAWVMSLLAEVVTMGQQPSRHIIGSLCRFEHVQYWIFCRATVAE